jgi:hypothetical protein
MSIRNTVKKIWFSLYNSERIVLLDFPIKPLTLYPDKHPHQKLFDLIESNKTIYEQFLRNTLKYKDAFQTIIENKLIKNEFDPGWNNGYLPGLDIIMLYSLLSQINPSKYLEIGSGTSTKVAYKSRKENSLNYEIISIDPLSRQNISKVTDKVYKQKIQQIDTKIFQTLDENDIIFFDGTHVLYPNSDVMWFFIEILPILRKGVVIHIHDIYLPYDYPNFMLERYYNEQYILGSLLLSNPEKYEILCPNYFIYSERELHGTLNPIWKLDALKNVEQHGGSFWIKIRV